MNKRIREMKNIFSQEEIEVFGIVHGKHLKFVTSIGPVYASCSPGDHRSARNLRSLIRRMSRK